MKAIRTIQLLVTFLMFLPFSGEANNEFEIEAFCSVVRGPVNLSETCPHPKGWQPSDEQLSVILQASKEAGLSLNRPHAVLCNANLRNSDLSGVILAFADLRWADLSNANLEGAYLNGANLQHANLLSASMKKIVLDSAVLENTDLSYASLMNASLEYASLRESTLSHAILKNANLRCADLESAKLLMSNLELANLDFATLKNVYGEKIVLRGAKLRGADLEGANLQRSQLQNADFFMANLKEADLYLANLEGSKLAGTYMTQTNYAPYSAPPDGYLVGIHDLQTVVFPPGQQSGVVQLRNLLKDQGLRLLERETTCAIESNKAKHDRHSDNWSRKIIGVLKLVLLEWTTGFGLEPQRAIYILVLLACAMVLIYVIPIAGFGIEPDGRNGIIRIWPAGRIEVRSSGFAPAGKEKMELLIAKGSATVGWALYFSLLSAFHFGWRDLNPGTWLTRVQPSEFVLRGRGWVRVVSGLQSLVSLYLIAMWILTYFGRPFQ
jgi:uncharacterized protein YjbI with pentapeptide repeats